MQGTRNIANKYSYHTKKVIIVYALAISVIWHVLWMGIFNVDLSAPTEKELVVTQAVFLGDFLQKAYLSKTLGSFTTGKDKKAVALMEKEDQVGAILPKRIISKDERNTASYVKANDNLHSVSEKTLIERYTFKDEGVSTPLLDIKGPLGKRGLVYLPQKPVVPKWLSDNGAFSIKEKIFVDKMGRVVFVEQLSSTGYLEIDLLIKKYLKKIRFSEDASTLDTANQWGTVNIKLEVAND